MNPNTARRGTMKKFDVKLAFERLMESEDIRKTLEDVTSGDVAPGMDTQAEAEETGVADMPQDRKKKGYKKNIATEGYPETNNQWNAERNTKKKASMAAATSRETELRKKVPSFKTKLLGEPKEVKAGAWKPMKKNAQAGDDNVQKPKMKRSRWGNSYGLDDVGAEVSEEVDIQGKVTGIAKAPLKNVKTIMKGQPKKNGQWGKGTVTPDGNDDAESKQAKVGGIAGKELIRLKVRMPGKTKDSGMIGKVNSKEHGRENSKGSWGMTQYGGQEKGMVGKVNSKEHGR